MPSKKKTPVKRPVRKGTASAPRKAKAPKTSAGFSALERNILLGKGADAASLARMARAGIRSKQDFRTVGDAATLVELSGLAPEAAGRVLAWALAGGAGDKLVVESGDSVHCVSCGRRQPKDFKSGDLCVYCGKQAEPVFACYWCSASGPGKFCRGCGATFVSPGELELAILLKRDGLPKEAIPQRLASLSPVDKEALWARVRARR